ncbi:cytosine permease [Aeromicrobium sp. IC_218]|uniref:purine-cytosine permease family protein n=1 Tax=Aeromicrobium sp. IC_218 TaxID=2545468 RepID=UPI00103BC955|nr:cytosine permease [Aeromicrobium sp. IC_218]TCI99103.1 allantoin permease [Aeromicrobium sp. IC_218]
MTHPEQPLEPTRVELNGTNVIAEDERKGTPRDLFWPWTAASISVFGVTYGSFALDYGVSWWQVVLAAIVGVVGSGVLAGLIAIAGKRGSAPTLVLSRASFGVTGNKLPAAVSWLLSVGWEIVLVSLAALGTSTVFEELGWGGGDATTAVALAVVVALVIAGGVLGYDAVMRIQTFITYVGIILTVVYVVLVIDTVDLDAVTSLSSGGFPAVVGVVILMMTATGLGWVNAAADYSRYLPRSSSGAGVAGWTALGLSAAPLVLILFGLMLAGSDPALKDAIGINPIGALATLLPTWFLIPFVVVAVLGLVAGALLDIYSSGLSLLSLGLPVSRPVAAAIDGVIMVIGSVLVLFVATGSFFDQFQGFLITLGVPIAAWAGIMLADIALRRRDFDDAALFDPAGRYGAFRWGAIGTLVVGTVVGWGLVTNTYAGWLDWQGYFMGLLGGKDGAWAFASVGVVVALLIGFLGYLLLERGTVRRQEAQAA